jgi:hypothetical protein
MRIEIYCTDIDSTMVKSMIYTEGKLIVTFNNNNTYVYDKVRLKSFLNVITSDSIGQAFSKYIKGSYSYKEIGESEDFFKAYRESIAGDGESK